MLPVSKRATISKREESGNRNPGRGNRFPSPVLVLLLALAMLLLPGTGGSPANANGRIVTVGVYENAPKIFTADNGRPAGILIDVIEEIARREGWTLQYVPGSWGECLDRLARGEIDLMPDVAFTPERAKWYSFHMVPVLSSWFQVYAPKGSNIHSILDLNGKRVLVLERSIQEEAFVRISKGFGLNNTLMTVPDYKTMFEMVARGEADVAVTNRFYGMMHAREYGLVNTAVVFEPSDLFYAAPRGDPRGLLDAIDRHLSDLKTDPGSVYYESLKRWTSEEVRFRMPAWVWMLGLVLGVVLVMSLLGSMVLKKQVDLRTRELRQINLEMEQRIRDRTAELAVAMEKAQAADRIKSAFLATMSHELRTPLNSIIGFTGIMLQGLAGPLNDEQHKQMSMVQNSSRHLLALINDVLDISKIEAGQLDLAVAPFELRPSIEKTVRLVSPMAAQKGIDLRVDISGEIGAIETDQRRLEQILLNLINNAVKFTDKGHVGLSCRRENGQYVLSVSDTGIGIRPEDMDGLFQPFHQVDTGLARKHEGTGLGLSICKKLLDIMNGSIEVKSEVGQGSTFTVRLPIASGEKS